VIMEITGHSTRQMFDRYNTIDSADKKEAVEKFTGFLRGESKDSESSDANAGQAQ